MNDAAALMAKANEVTRTVADLLGLEFDQTVDAIDIGPLTGYTMPLIRAYDEHGRMKAFLQINMGIISAFADDLSGVPHQGWGYFAHHGACISAPRHLNVDSTPTAVAAWARYMLTHVRPTINCGIPATGRGRSPTSAAPAP